MGEGGWGPFAGQSGMSASRLPIAAPVPLWPPHPHWTPGVLHGTPPAFVQHPLPPPHSTGRGVCPIVVAAGIAEPHILCCPLPSCSHLSASTVMEFEELRPMCASGICYIQRVPAPRMPSAVSTGAAMPSIATPPTTFPTKANAPIPCSPWNPSTCVMQHIHSPCP